MNPRTQPDPNTKELKTRRRNATPHNATRKRNARARRKRSYAPVTVSERVKRFMVARFCRSRFSQFHHTSTVARKVATGRPGLRSKDSSLNCYSRSYRLHRSLSIRSDPVCPPLQLAPRSPPLAFRDATLGSAILRFSPPFPPGPPPNPPQFGKGKTPSVAFCSVFGGE